MSVITTCVATPAEPQLQPGDLVTAIPERLWFGRVFDVEEHQHVVRVWWSSTTDPRAVEGLRTHLISEVHFVERPNSYASVVFEQHDRRYGFVIAGDGDLPELAAFERASNYTVLSSKIRQHEETTADTTSHEDDDDDAPAEAGR
jgi:hypothetical protein